MYKRQAYTPLHAFPTTLRGELPSRLYAHSSHATITFDLETESTHGQPTSRRAPLLAFEYIPPSHIYFPLLSHPTRPAPSHRACGVLWPMAMTAVDSSSSAVIYIHSPYVGGGYIAWSAAWHAVRIIYTHIVQGGGGSPATCDRLLLDWGMI